MYFLYTIFQIKKCEKNPELLSHCLILTPVYVISRVEHVGCPSLTCDSAPNRVSYVSSKLSFSARTYIRGG